MNGLFLLLLLPNETNTVYIPHFHVFDALLKVLSITQLYVHSLGRYFSSHYFTNGILIGSVKRHPNINTFDKQIIQMKTDQYIHETLSGAKDEFDIYKNTSYNQRLQLAKEIVRNIELNEEALINTAHQETNLEKERLKTELQRSCFQFISYASTFEQANRFYPSISTVKKDIRKLFVPIGPVVVYGASNFPFAYSTLGGDVASALAAGCIVVVKAHEAHIQTARLSATIIKSALINCGLPERIFQQVELSHYEDGRTLIQHPFVQAVGFTGSLNGGHQLFKWAAEREKPIPVFSEMGSVNPVFIMENLGKEKLSEYAKKLSVSITNSGGQFCTKPGLIFGIESAEWQYFKEALGNIMENIPPQKLLYNGILKSFEKQSAYLINQSVVKAKKFTPVKGEFVSPILLETHCKDLIQHEVLQMEVFGPYSLLVTCSHADEMIDTLKILKGQLTATILLEEPSMAQKLLSYMQDMCGRVIINDVPTGVEVVASMQHSGPFPACTDSRFTAVGEDALLRFLRPLTYQNFPDALLPDELKNENPLQLIRNVNGKFTKEKLQDD
jgi:NADP-dependent aldehyde dehydrogenase